MFKTIGDFTLIKLNKFLKILQNIDTSYKDLTEINILVRFLKSVQNTANNNIQILNRYIHSLETLLSIIDYMHLTRKSKKLQEELELSKIKRKSSKLSAKTNLLDKLNKELSKNKKELKFLEEDFSRVKNQRNQILEQVNNYKEKISELNRKKKQKFDKINQITRSMEKGSEGESSKLELGSNLSNAEMIKKLRQEAKETHYKIKTIRDELKETQVKLDDFAPEYETLRDDYNSLKETINHQKSQIKNAKEDINQIMEQTEDEKLKSLKVNKFPNIRNQDVIKTEIEQTNREINRLKKNYDLIDESGNIREKIDRVSKEITGVSDFIKENEDSLRITKLKEQLSSAVEALRKIDLLLNELEELVNKCLKEIDLSVDLRLSIAEDSFNFFIHPVFTRRNESGLEFPDLTTPEKVFFTIIIYLCNHIILNDEDIVFSNLFLHDNFNKRGSLFRTFRKSIPILNNIPSLNDRSFVLLISKLPMKRSIDNKHTKIINLKE